MIVEMYIEHCRDRIGLFWSDLSNHIARIVVKSHGHTHLLERTVVGLLHLVTRLLGRQSSAIQVRRGGMVSLHHMYTYNCTIPVSCYILRYTTCTCTFMPCSYVHMKTNYINAHYIMCTDSQNNIISRPSLKCVSA